MIFLARQVMIAELPRVGSLTLTSLGFFYAYPSVSRMSQNHNFSVLVSSSVVILPWVRQEYIVVIVWTIPILSPSSPSDYSIISSPLL